MSQIGAPRATPTTRGRHTSHLIPPRAPPKRHEGAVSSPPAARAAATLSPQDICTRRDGWHSVQTSGSHVTSTPTQSARTHTQTSKHCQVFRRAVACDVRVCPTCDHCHACVPCYRCHVGRAMRPLPCAHAHTRTAFHNLRKQRARVSM